jgi:ornithine--oxo-acid transaminase
MSMMAKIEGGHGNYATNVAVECMAREQRYLASNYAPLPVVISRALGCKVWDVEGREYLDMMSAYSAASFGHGHPRILRALTEQAAQLAVTSRAFHSDQLGLLGQALCQATGMDKMLPMNTGAEAVETAIKCVRKWAHEVKKVPHGKAEIIVFEYNFHGRTSTIVSFSSHEQYREPFAPSATGFKRVMFGDINALAQAITANTAAVLIEPVQGEGGIIVPPRGYLRAARELCREHNVMFIADEVQTGMGRTGKLLAVEHDGLVGSHRPDGVIMGKALGGGVYPVSAFLATDALMGVFKPGDHGSTFGGNALAARIGIEALAVLKDEGLVERSAQLGEWLQSRLKTLGHPAIKEVRGRGLFIGLALREAVASAHDVVMALMRRGVLTKDTHGNVVRLAPALTITEDELDMAVTAIKGALDDSMYPLKKVA